MGFRPAIVIPARYGSTRLPAKALKKIGAKTLIQHVWERALEADIAKVYVATDHSLIQEVVEDFGGTVIRTSEGCLTGSDRVAESLRHLPEEADSVINIQGDLPFIETSRLKEVLKPLCAGFDVATMLAPMPADRQSDPSTVKAIVSPAESTLIEDEELYRCHWFCRTALPYGMFHFGVYAYTRTMLQQFAQFPQSQAERAESLEQLRFFAMGCSIGAIAVRTTPFEVNTKEDYHKACEMLGA